LRLIINGTEQEVDAPADMPLLWVLRDRLYLTGTRYGCGAGLCGACTVHVDGRAVRACSVPIGEVDDREVTTIEGASGPMFEAVRDAWVEAVRKRPDRDREEQEHTTEERVGNLLEAVLTDRDTQDRVAAVQRRLHEVERGGPPCA